MRTQTGPCVLPSSNCFIVFIRKQFGNTFVQINCRRKPESYIEKKQVDAIAGAQQAEIIQLAKEKQKYIDRAILKVQQVGEEM